jgi:hypothetical protein
MDLEKNKLKGCYIVIGSSVTITLAMNMDMDALWITA